MLQTWTMPTPKITGIAERGGSPTEGAENPLTPLDEAGFIATLATNSEFEIVRYLRLGEVVTSTMVIESVSDKKQTRIGPRTLHHLGDDVSRRAGRGRRPADVPHPQVQARPGGPAEMSDRLAPTTTPDTKFFWDALKEGKLLIQRCSGCATLRHPPRPMCPRCNSLAWDTIESSGRGEVYSFVLPRHPPWPWFEGTYIVALVELEEGTRIVSNLCDVDPDDVTIGMPVQAFIEHFDNGVSLPQFRPRRDG